ncbi:MAG: hypothetical protein ABJA67_13030 [Chthonomonadales bacterium]
MKIQNSFVMAATAACLISTSLAHADVSFGSSARLLGMGGAGIAVVDRADHNTGLNPAALALNNRRSQIFFPNVGLHASGIPIKEAYKHLIQNPGANDAVDLARDFGGQNSEFSAALGFGARVGHMDAMTTGIGLVRIIPNADLKNWSKTGNGDLTKLNGNEKADVYGAAIYSLPIIGAAERISPKGSPIRVEAGTRIKLSRSVYTHYLVSSSNIMNNTVATPASELGSGTTITKDGIGVDFGLLAHPTSHQGFSVALLVNNLLDPGFRIAGTDVNGNPAKFDLQPRSITVGSALEAGKFLFVADAVDITRAYGNVQGRLGMELTTRKVSYRLGYSSARGFTAGIGWRFVQVAFGARAPLEIIKTLRF